MFKDKLKELRESNNYSMDKLAELYNKKFNGKLNKSTISRYENGLQEPIYTVVRNFATLFQISVDEMIDERIFDSNKPVDNTHEGIYTPSIGMFVQFVRHMRKASKTDIAHLTDISYERLKQIERAYTEITDDEIIKISEALGVTSHMMQNGFIPSDMSNPFISKLGRQLNEYDYHMLESYNKLDNEDKAEIRGEIKQMLKADKYSNNEIIGIGRAAAYGGEKVEVEITREKAKRIHELKNEFTDNE